MELVMAQAVECPLYQLQTVTVYNCNTISPDSFSGNYDSYGFSYIIPMLKAN